MSDPKPSAATPAPMQAPLNETQFKRSISPDDFARLDPKTKEQLARAQHLGIVRSSHEAIVAQLKEALERPRVGPDGASLPPFRLDELVAVLMHRDDMIVPPPMREKWIAENLEVGAFVAERLPLSQGLKSFVHVETGTHPYLQAGNALADAPPPDGFYVAVFSLNMATVTVFHPEPEAAPEAPPADAPATIP
jgi:hypothetical protein